MKRDMTQGALRVIKAAAPMRICDNGGWTDTWFAKYGTIFNIAVYPYAEVQVAVFPRRDDKPRIRIHAENFGEDLSLEKPAGSYTKHPLIEAALERMEIPGDVRLEVNIYSEAPVGCSTGTSAAVSVALIGALDRLTPGEMTAYEVARTAQIIETEMLHQQCGIQDQLASAYGGINYIEMYEYPNASVSPVHVGNALWWELESRLALVYLGHSHVSSDVHREVIRSLEGEGPESARLKPLRGTAIKARQALTSGDFAGFGRSMIENTEHQIGLHEGLAGEHHRKVIAIAKEHGALGWKINGAGGAGGSVTLLCSADMAAKRSLLRTIQQENANYRAIPIYLSRQGLRVWNAVRGETGTG